ncbi:MAG: glycosyltransferase family 2 protein [Balneolaceae bacterium]
MKTTFSIIIVTWNAIHHLKRFLPSVADTDYPNLEIIIADNASDDGSGEWVENHYPQCKVITFDENHGYCGGNNRAARHANGEVLIFLNNDVETDPNWLNTLDLAFRNKKADIVQPKMRSVENRRYFEYAGAAGGFIDWLGYPFCRGRIFDVVEEDHGQYDESVNIFWASGAAFAIRKDLFLETGGFDEDFEFHMEEIDLCWRCHHLDSRIICEPGSIVYHLGGGSLPMGSPRKVFYNYRNSLIMLTKNLDHLWVLKLLLRMILDGVAGIRSLLYGRPSELWAIIRAHFSFYSMFGKVLAKRRETKRSGDAVTFSDSPVKSQRGISRRLIIIQAFVLGKDKFSDLNL